MKRGFKRWRAGRDRRVGYYGRFNRPVYYKGELKFHDIDIVDVFIDVSGTILAPSCNLIAQGTGESERIGRKCRIKSIDWRMSFRKNASTATAGDDVVRIILYLDKQTNGAAATILDILDTADYQSFPNLANSSRFSFLMDRTFAINSHAGGGNGTTQDLYSFMKTLRFRKRCNIPLEFNLTAGVIAELRSNNLGVLTISREGTSGMESTMRLRFSG